VNQFLLVVAVALTVGLIVFGITVLVTGEDAGLRPVEPDGRSISLPGDRPLGEADVTQVRFDTAMRGYRMAQVDTALRRAAYDIGYKDELIRVLQAEVDALRDGRLPEAEVLRRAREAALAPIQGSPAPAEQPELEIRLEATATDAVEDETSR
jgi:DivIVA domain-containing protein